MTAPVPHWVFQHLLAEGRKVDEGPIMLRPTIPARGACRAEPYVPPRTPPPTWQPAAPRGTSPISKAPPEIFVKVFRELRDSMDGETMIPTLDWQAVTSVSRRWREIALSDPCLWTTIVLGAPTGMVTLMLERTNGLPLRIRFTLKTLLEHIEIIKKHAGRVQSLIQTIDPRNFCHPSQDKLFDALYAHRFPSMPLLEELRLYPYKGYRENDHTLLHEDSVLANTPNFRTLSIIDGSTAVSLRAVRTRQLRSLVLGVIPTHHDQDRNLKSLFDFIRACPLLEEISVGANEPIPPIELRHLRRLRLVGDLRGVLTILCPLIFDPLCADMWLHAHLNTRKYSESRFDFASLPVLPNGPGACGGTFAWMRFVNTRTCVEAGFNSKNIELSFTLRITSTSYRTHSNVQVINEKAPASSTMDAVWRAFKLGKMEDVRTLAFNFPTGRSPLDLDNGDDWHANVEIAVVSSRDLMTLCDALLTPVSGYRGRAFLPALKRIRIVRANGSSKGALLSRGRDPCALLVVGPSSRKRSR